MHVGQVTDINTASIQANYIKNNVSQLNTQQIMDNSQINIPSFCDLLASSNCQSAILTQKVIFFLFYFFNLIIKKIIFLEFGNVHGFIRNEQKNSSKHYKLI